MRTRTTARRSIALLATTALLTGGLATGMLTSPAYAAPGDPAHLTSVSPTAWDNRSTAVLGIDGTNFVNGDPTGQLNDSVELVPVAALADATNEVGTIVGYVDTATPPNATHVTVSIPLAMAAPGAYTLRVVHVDGTPSDNSLPFSIYAFGPASASSVAFGPNASTASGDARGAGPLDIRGTNFAVGAKVAFLKAGAVDPGLTFRQGNPGNDTNPVGTQGADGKDNDSGYPSTTLLQGNYSYSLNADGTNAFTPGLHDLRVYNTDEPVPPAAGGSTTTFSQPYYGKTGAVSPTSIGQGAQNVLLTVTGQGIRAGSSLSVQKLGPNTCADVSVGAATVSNSDGNGTFTTIKAPVSFAECSAATSRAVTIVGPDGASFTRSSQLNVGGKPHITAVEDAYDVLGQGASVGYGTDGVWQSGEGVLVEGTNFAGQSTPADPATWVAFNFGPGVTVVTRGVLSGGALVTIDVTDDAVVGERTVRATNPDGGSTTTSKPPVTSDPLGVAPFEVEAGPKADKVSPAGFDPSQSGTGVTVTGSFLADHTYSVAVNRQAGTVNISGVSVASNGKSLSFSMSTNNAAPGPMDLIITDTDNFGRDVCESCMGINSLKVSAVNGVPLVTSAPNTGSATIELEATDVVNSPLTSGANSTVTLSRQVPLPGQGSINGTSVTAAVANKVTAVFDLTRVAPGKYSAAIYDPATSKSWTCTGCLTVTSAGNITVTKFEPATGGQGSSNRLVTVEGTNFAKGMTVTIPDVSVHDLVLDPTSPTTKFTFQVDVADDAPTGAKTAVIAAGDGSSPATSTGSQVTKTFTVSAKPSGIADITPATYAQGAGSNGTPVPLTLTADVGTLQPGAVVTMGPGITVTTTGVTTGCTFPDDILAGCSASEPDTLTATMVVAEVTTVEKRAVTVTNPDGGASTVPDAFTVTAGPKVTSFANEKGQPYLTPDGVDHTVTVFGSGFVASPKTVVKILKADGTVDDKLTYDPAASSTVVEPGKITLVVKTAVDAVLGARKITVTNSDAGKGFGSCTTCVAVAKAPSAVSSFTLVSGAKSLAASWGAVTTDNGAPVTGYKLSIQVGSGTPTVVAAPASPRSYTFGNLVNGVTYTVKIAAVNGVGEGPTTTRTGIAGLPSALTIKVSPTATTYGSPFVVSGKLTSNGVGIGGKTLILTFVPTVGKSYARTVTTVASGTAMGTWAYRTNSVYTTRVKAQLVPNDATYRPASTSYVTEVIRVRITRTAPANGARSGYTTLLKVTGTVAPNKRGKYAYLFRYVSGKRTLMQRVTISSTSTFLFSIKPGKGTYYFKVYVPATTGNAANYSTTFKVIRV
ncbi:MAG TPA: fibronectin type III domain-containing protein [Mycobacteriales bacterium]|nr:fibronectin type III domain-containing protein [Mycobacteriales bacterium]